LQATIHVCSIRENLIGILETLRSVESTHEKNEFFTNVLERGFVNVFFFIEKRGFFLQTRWSAVFLTRFFLEKELFRK
jgi:hypothetical protein